MPNAARQQETIPAEWLRIEEAATATRESLRSWQRRAAREDADARRLGRKSLAVKAGAADGRGKAVWWVSREIDPRLSRYQGRDARDERSRQALIVKYPAHLVERALRRNHWLQHWRKECRSGSGSDRVAAERTVIEARRVEADGFRVSVRSLYAWQRRYARLGATGRIVGVEGLIDRYGGDGGDGDGGDSRSPEAVEFFYDLYRTENKIAAAICHDVTVRESRKRGWKWPPSYTATLSWLRRRDDLALTFLMRNGKRAWHTSTFRTWSWTTRRSSPVHSIRAIIPN